MWFRPPGSFFGYFWVRCSNRGDRCSIVDGCVRKWTVFIMGFLAGGPIGFCVLLREDVEHFGDILRGLHRILCIASGGCSTSGRFRLYPTSIQRILLNGCRIWLKQAFHVPSDSAQTEDGCMICTKQVFKPHPIKRHAEIDGKWLLKDF